MKFPRRKDCVVQGAAMWCQLACYLTIVKSSNTQHVLENIGFANEFSLTHPHNEAFMREIFRAIGRSRNVSVGFSLNELDMINRKFGFNVPVPTTYENIANMPSRRAYFDLFNRKSGYIILKFHTGKARHFCVLTDVKTDNLFIHDPQRISPPDKPFFLKFNSDSNSYYWGEAGEGWKLVAYQEL